MISARKDLTRGFWVVIPKMGVQTQSCLYGWFQITSISMYFLMRAKYRCDFCGDIAGGFYVPISTPCSNNSRGQQPAAKIPTSTRCRRSSPGFLATQTKMKTHRLNCIFN